MIALSLQDALVRRLEEVFGDEYTLKDKNGKEKPLRLFPQYLPRPRGIVPKKKAPGGKPEEDPEIYGPEDFEANFPCIVVKLDEGRDKEENAPDATRIDVRILVGVYDDDPDCQGYRDVLNVLEKIRLELLTHRYLERKYRLEMPFRWYLHEDQPWPVFFGQIETVWETARVVDPGPVNSFR